MFDWMKVLGSRIRGWLSMRHVDEDFSEELEAHLEMLTQENIRQGMTPEQAQRAARLKLGGATQLRETNRELRGLPAVDTILKDVRYAFRTLRKNFGYTAVVVLTLALGIGANSTVFSWINATLLNPLPGVADQTRVVTLMRTSGERFTPSFSYPDYEDLRNRNHVFSGLIASAIYPMSLTYNEKPERIWGTVVSENYFDDFGVKLQYGRGFLPAEGKVPGGAPVAVISYHLWESSFDGNPAIVGQKIQLNNHTYTIVGVAPREFLGSYTALRSEIWVPMMMHHQLFPIGPSPATRLKDRGVNWLIIQGRLKPGVRSEQAQAELNTLLQQIAEQYPKEHEGRQGISVYPLWKVPFGATAFLGTVLMSLMAIAGVVLLLACANVANLMLVRGVSRTREMGIRLSLGATRGRLVAQLLTESIMLAILGGGVAVLVTLWTSKSFASLRPPSQLPIWINIDVDRRVLLVSLAISILTGIVFGLLPALRASGINPASAMKEESGSASGGPRKFRLSSGLAVAQIALSLLMLVFAGLMIRSFQKAQRFNPGFNPNNVLLASYDLLPEGYTDDRGLQFHQQLLTKMEALPGVQVVSLSDWVPLGFIFSSSTFVPEGYQAKPHELIEAGVARVSPNYFRTMEIPLLEGRDFRVEDTRKTQSVVIINQALADRYWPRQDAVGKRMGIDGGWATVIGIARTSNYNHLNEPPDPFIYQPLYRDYLPSVTLHLRVNGKPADFALAAQNTIHEMNANLPVFDIIELATRTQVASGVQRIAGSTVGVFGLLALALAAVGIYGVIAYSTNQHTHEIGIRMALGAHPRDILRLVLSQGVRLTLVGGGIGLAASFLLARLLSSLLFGVSSSDPFTFAGVTILLAGAALLACYIPARRATKVDPLVALRHE
jgi:predicted permease